MRVVLQRVSRARVTVDDEVVAEVGAGFLLLVGVTAGDSEDDVSSIASKIAGLRVFSDDNGLMNHSLSDVQGSVLVVSQFTLYGDVKKGRRPSFVRAAEPMQAAALIEALVEELRERGHQVETGRFGASMLVDLVNDGPVTLVIESRSGVIL